jgi:hypothetical protein
MEGISARSMQAGDMAGRRSGPWPASRWLTRGFVGRRHVGDVDSRRQVVIRM